MVFGGTVLTVPYTHELQIVRRGRRPRRPVVGAGLRARPIVILSRQAKNLVSRKFTVFYWRSFAIAQDDKLGVVYPIVGANTVRPYE